MTEAINYVNCLHTNTPTHLFHKKNCIILIIANAYYLPIISILNHHARQKNKISLRNLWCGNSSIQPFPISNTFFKKLVPVNDQFKKAYFEPDRWSLGKDLSLTETQESHLLRWAECTFHSSVQLWLYRSIEALSPILRSRAGKRYFPYYMCL